MFEVLNKNSESFVCQSAEHKKNWSKRKENGRDFFDRKMEGIGY
jgi:hypothetical protein